MLSFSKHLPPPPNSAASVSNEEGKGPPAGLENNTSILHHLMDHGYLVIEKARKMNLPVDCCPAGRRLRCSFLLPAYGCPGKITTVISKDRQFWQRSEAEPIRGVRKAQSGWEFLHTPCCTPHGPQACLLEHIHFTKWRYKQTVITSGLLKRWAAAIKLLV